MENNQVIDNKEVNNQTQENSNEVIEKTFTQEDVDRIINKQFAKWKQKMEEEKNKVAEAERLEKMSAEERSKNELEKLKKQLEEIKKSEARKDLTNSTLKEMSARGIDADFLEFIIGEDADITKNRLDTFEEKFNLMVNERVDALVAERFKGKTPITSTNKTQSNEFTVEDIKRMSPSDINKYWDKIKHIKLNQ
jgi:hypothetical protein